MTVEQATLYWFAARDNLLALGLIERPDHDPTCGSVVLANILGFPYFGVGYWDKIDLTDQLRYKLMLLAGPHANTILKAIKARENAPN